MIADEIAAYYRRGGEAGRLADGAGRLEFLRTLDVLRRALPPPPASILDVGGATGVYAGPLAESGYAIHVVDPMPEHIAIAAHLPGVTATVGDARHLDAADASVDAVLLMGPLYHLVSRQDRLRAWQEAARAVRPGGPVIGATISRFASLFDGFLHGFYQDPSYRAVVESALRRGAHRADEQKTWFTTAYFHRPEELPDEVTDAGLVLDRVVSVESPLWLAVSELGLDDPARVEVVLDMIRQIEDEPSLLGSSAHLLAIARRPGA